MTERVGPYTIVGEIGRGGMAAVYLARQPVLARSVALKKLVPFGGGDQSLAQRFIREARVAGSLNHRNVVTVYDFIEQDGVPYIAMEYLERGSLRPFVGKLSLSQIAGVLEGLLAGLSHAESKGIAHRDIKPENLLVTADGGIKIADFGIAKAYQQVATEEMLTPAGATVGTPAYMAPEQAMGQEIGPWTDLYQSGVVAYELLAETVPFRADGTPIAMMMQHITEPVPPLPEGTDPALEGWVSHMLAKDAGARPANARAAWNEFEEIIVATLGPLWRRDAWLGEPDPSGEHSLTPAQFSSWHEYVPRTAGTPAPPPPPGTPPPVTPIEPPRADTPPPITPPPAETLPPVTPAEPPPPVTPDVAPPPVVPVETPRVDTPPPVVPAETPRADAPPPVVPVETPRVDTPPPVVPAETPQAATPPPADEPWTIQSPRASAPTAALATPPPASRRRPPVLLFLGLGLVAVIAVVVLLLSRGGDEDPIPTPTPTVTATVTATATPTPAQAAGPFAVGDGPDGIAIGAGAVWVAGSRDGTLTRIDPESGETTSVEVGENPDGVVVAFDEVWVSLTGEDKVARVSTDPQPELLGTVDVGSRPEGLTASPRAIWVANSGDGTITQIVAATRATRTISGVAGQPVDVAVGAGAVWVADSSGDSVARVDGGRRQLVTTIVGIGPNPRSVVILGRDVWVVTADDGRAWRIDGDANTVEGSVNVGGMPRDIATDGQHLFVTDRERDRVVEIDPETMRVVQRNEVPGGPLEVAVDDAAVWASGFDSGEVTRIAR